MKPIALDDLIVNDGETWLSKLEGAMGRPAAQAVLARRAGNWPLVAGVELREDVLHLATYVERTDDPRSAKALLYRMVQPEQTLLRRLLVADYELPGGAPDVLQLCLGPWDIAASGDTWTARDLLRPDDLAATLEGGWEITDGGLYLHRDNEPEVTVDNPLLGGAGTLEFWYLPEEDYTGPTRYLFSTTDGLALYYDGDRATFVLTDGTNVAESSAQTFAAETRLHLVAVWSDDGLRLYVNGALAGSAGDYSPGDLTTLWLGSDTGDLVDFPATPVLDRFNRANGGPPPSADWLNDDYYVPLGGLVVESLACTGTIITGGANPGYWSEIAGPDCEAYFTFETLDTDGLYLGIRLSSREWSDLGANPSTGYFILVYPAGNYVVLARKDGGTPVVLTSWMGLSLAPGDSFGLRGVGSELSVYYRPVGGDWLLLGTVDDATYGAAGYLALILRSTTARVEDFGGGAVSYANPCDGLLLTVRGWNAALTAGQVRSLYRRGWNWQARWLEVTPLGCVPVVEKGRDLPHARMTALQVHGDRLWRSPGKPSRFNMDDNDITETITNDGDADAYPIIRLTPRQAKSNGYAYARWVAVLWNGAASGGEYPTLLGEVDTAALVSAGKALASGDDWRVFADGVEVARWFGSGAAAFNQAATKTWINLEWEAAAVVDLETAIGSGDTVESVDADGDISAFPSSGILVIEHGGNYEAFTYTGKNDPEQRFTGVTRAAKGTTALDLDPGDTITWIQHDVWLYYGDAGAAAPSYDDNYQPIIDLDDSDNETWVYNEFGANSGLRTGAWSNAIVLQQGSATVTIYTDDHEADTDPWEETGALIDCTLGRGQARWWIYHPCGIVEADFADGEYKLYTAEGAIADDLVMIQSSADGSNWDDEYEVSLTSDGSWHSWSRNETLDAGAFYVGLFSDLNAENSTLSTEADAVTILLNDDLTPDVVLGDEQGNYALNMQITNQTLDEAVTVVGNLAIDETLVLDCDAGTCVLEPSMTSQLQMVTEVDGPRARWLRLAPGTNILHFVDAGTLDLDIDVLWERRLAE